MGRGETKVEERGGEDRRDETRRGKEREEDETHVVSA